MELETKQSHLIDHFLNLFAQSSSSSSRCVSLVVEATSHPSLFAFSGLLSIPNLLQLQETQDSPYLHMLRVFAHGTWTDYKRKSDSLPELTPPQILKLKQLTLLTLAETNKVLHYDQLMQELDVPNVRELEDFLIDECIYVGIVRGKLDHLGRCFQVQFAAGRDLIPGQLESMIEISSKWLSASENLLVSIQEKIKWADNMFEIDKKHKSDVEQKVEEMKSLSLHNFSDLWCPVLELIFEPLLLHIMFVDYDHAMGCLMAQGRKITKGNSLLHFHGFFIPRNIIGQLCLNAYAAIYGLMSLTSYKQALTDIPDNQIYSDFREKDPKRLKSGVASCMSEDLITTYEIMEAAYSILKTIVDKELIGWEFFEDKFNFETSSPLQSFLFVLPKVR
ncbi:hypothetical protein RJT34_22372 [Clitoria ternatea]|uniref:PCI domain-containing protein n=1 Tax=Clitoria ternatea TaxID=43366 RepID=A0AAN9P6S1_CLITE